MPTLSDYAYLPYERRTPFNDFAEGTTGPTAPEPGGYLSPVQTAMGGGGDWWTNNGLPQTGGAFLPGDQVGAAGMTGGAGDPSAYFNQLFPGDYLDSAMLIAKEAELGQQGIKVLRNAEGRAGKIQLPNGQIIDVVQGGGTGVNRKQWLTGDGGTGSSGLPGMGGTLIDPWTKAFQPRNPADVANDPGYQFQMQQGLQGVERGAAAKGTLLTGGTLKALSGYGQGLASTYLDKYYNRDMQEYLLGRENFYNNQDRPYTKLSGLATLGRPYGGG